MKCDKCAFRNIFLVTNEKIYPSDGDECGVYGLGKCSIVYFQYCNGICFSPIVKNNNVQLTLNFDF